jgi:D-beta-D-heptose 7-phosphate kinase/D-beta-D-heptose 1-phosphate adenosyltransferase
MQEIQSSYRQNRGKYSLKEKIKDLKILTKLVSEHKNKEEKVVFTNGCYDLIHIGHIQCFQESKAQGEILIVALNSDRSIRALKGPSRPIIPEEERAEIVAAMESVDYVTIFDQEDPLEIISTVKPDVLVKGSDWSVNTIVGKDVVEAYGGTVLALPMIPGVSTSRIIEDILSHTTPK